MTHSSEGVAKGRYEKFAMDRRPYLDRARRSAQLTIPSLVPPEGHTADTKYPTPYQGLGARGVNMLASKLLLALFPPNQSFFRLTLDDFALEELTKRQGAKAEVEKVLGKIERAVGTDMEQTAFRVHAFEGLKLLVVSGNAMLWNKEDGRTRVFPLERYVTKRDPDGRLLETITLEKASPLALPIEVCAACGVNQTLENGQPKPVEIYTRVVRDGNMFNVYQEINGNIVPGSEGSYPEDKLPWVPLRMIKVDGEDYGRGYVEEYLGDLISLEGLTKAIVTGSAAAAKVLFLVNPNGTTKIRDLAKKASGGFVTGNADDISTLRLDKAADFRVALETIDKITQRVSYSFLMNSSVQRSGERVTAEEIRYMAGELEDALGGVYSVLTQEFQQPIVNVRLSRMERDGRLPPLPQGMVRPTITTGLEALGRGHDLRKLQAFLEHLAPLGPEVLQTYMNIDDYIKRVGTSLGVSIEGLIKDKEQVAQEQQQAQMAALMERAGPQIMQMMQAQGAEGEMPNA